MLTIKGRYEKGVIHPLEQIEGEDGQEVSILFPSLDEHDMPIEVQATDYDAMNLLTEQAPRYLKEPDLGLRLRALSDKAGYAASCGELTSR